MPGEPEEPRSDDALLGLARKIRTLGEGTPEREAYLERLAREIRAGSYRVDSRALARKLVESSEMERCLSDIARRIHDRDSSESEP